MKKMIINITLLISVGTFALTSCSTNTQSQNTGAGAVTGAVAGGLAGSLFGGGAGRAVAIGIGAVAGALVGGTIGHNMDSSDNSTLNKAMDTGNTNQKTSWNNQHSGVTYSVKPTSKVFSYHGNTYCRKFKSTATLNGKQEIGHGIACRKPNGTWHAVS
ncbi:MAG: hypothetical protein A3E85_00700 [Gammaproteobacteria bacterium RIFCSPHIGHO2_12_FULL_45_12]|nr:MAG: hypothetical protein A3E85_00700 [Gammaproteobacteria bacterium RIFCSPHIGHO2_12_FULL_45_12]